MRLLEAARRHGFQRGVMGGSRTWLVIGGTAWAYRGLRWAMRPETQTVYRSRLEVGETLVIRHDPPPPTRAQRRRTRRADKRMAEKQELATRKEARRTDRRDRRSKH